MEETRICGNGGKREESEMETWKKEDKIEEKVRREWINERRGKMKEKENNNLLVLQW